MSLKKLYSKTQPKCKVTFSLDNSEIKSAKHINIAGDFNSWDIESIPMKKQKNGEYTASVELAKGMEYQFKYIIDGKDWINDPEADKYVNNDYQSKNSVVVV
jgi:1,4-alpha-glucan branching enzyme